MTRTDCATARGFLREAPFCLRQQGRLPAARQPGNKPDPRPEDGYRERRWYCRACGYPVARHDDVLEVAGASEHHFANPAGQLFHVLCLAHAAGCAVTGKATMEWTWFPGHAWRYALCGGCSEHLGWHYAASATSFYALILNKLVERGRVE